MKRIALVAFVVLAAAGGAHAQLYKWKDASGRMQYGDRPPAGVTAEPMSRSRAVATSATAAPAAQVAAPRTPAEQEQEFRKRQLEKQEKAREEEKLAMETQAREENCRRAKLQLTSLESGVRQARLNDQGERIFLDDAGIEREKADARKAVSQHCK
jgi:hypothetical protein